MVERAWTCPKVLALIMSRLARWSSLKNSSNKDSFEIALAITCSMMVCVTPDCEM